MTPGVPGAPEPRIYPRSGYFLVMYISENEIQQKCNMNAFDDEHMYSMVSIISTVTIISTGLDFFEMSLL